ncbi:MAG: glycosyltransferase family 2 protein [Candidatus Eisenbacteria bacterium]|uniref:Glycosyltransferase family 2 protein n=1 Tax=Eiseniibacteriota bacterium TaxID=2212470 RepID=A0A7Y2E9M1_UNCEI|nr:glycosyltransferase family 2 protein [Candidatus Eisenbacteria bacterium]
MRPPAPTYPDISLSIFFPAYYDEHNIPKVVEGALAVVSEMGISDYEIIIVEDGSPDRTGEVADELAEKHEHVRVIHHEKNRGYGAALHTGFMAAKKENVFYTDGDNQFDLSELRRFVALLPYTDIVSGFRIQKQYSTNRKFTSATYNLVLRLLFDIHDRDVDCAFKLYPTELFKKFEIESRDAFIDAEIAIQARLLGYKSMEVGVRHLPRMDGISTGARPTVIFRTFREIYRFYKKYGKRIKELKNTHGA